MKIKVMYRAQCLAAALGYGPEYDAENIDEPTLIISISSTDDKLPLIMNEANNENIRHIEYLQFDDIDTAECVHGLKPMSDEDAGCIVDAFLQYVDGVSQIIVHCDAGYSRSPAVAAALAKALGGERRGIFRARLLHKQSRVHHAPETTVRAENPKIVAESCERHSMEV